MNGSVVSAYSLQTSNLTALRNILLRRVGRRKVVRKEGKRRGRKRCYAAICFDSFDTIASMALLSTTPSVSKVVRVSKFSYPLPLSLPSPHHLLLSRDVMFSFSTFTKAKVITFANQTFTVAPNTLKSTIKIFNWPFTNIKNRLKVWTSLQSDSQFAV